MLPHLLDSSQNEITRLHPDKLSIKINQTPLSTATMSLPEGEPTITLRQWAELYGPYGSLGKYRVSSVKADYGEGQNISLEHGIATLGDCLTAADTTLTGTPYAIMGTLLGYQSLWQRGTMPNTGNYSIKVDRSNVLSAVLDLIKQMGAYMLTYDFATWSVGIVALEASPSCEARLRRNAESVKITIDDNDMCTRVYAVGLTNGYMDADTVGTWGISAKSLGTADNAVAADVQAYATQYLAEHKNPHVSLEISAQELANKTGEAIDTFAVGKMCRVALPDWNFTTEHRIVAMNYPDILGDPDNVQLSLSTTARDLSHTLAGISTDLYGTSTVQGGGGGGGGGRGSGKGKLNEYHTAILRNTDSVQILAWDVDDLNADMITAQASITVNADNIALKASRTDVEALTSRVSSAEIDIDGANAAIALKASRTDVEALTSRVSTAEIDIDGANAAITLKASQTDVTELTSRVSSAEIDIDGANAAITLKVSKDGVISSINQTPESITISASKINLSGYVTASQLTAAFANFTASTIDSLTVTSLGVSSGVFGTLTANNTFRFGGETINKASTVVGVGLNVSKNTIHYDYGGASYSVSVVTGVSLDTSTILYLSH